MALRLHYSPFHVQQTGNVLRLKHINLIATNPYFWGGRLCCGSLHSWIYAYPNYSVCVCVKRLVTAVLLQITPSPPTISHEQNVCFSSRESSLLNLLDTRDKRSCFQPFLSLCLTQAPAERSVNQFWAGSPMPRSACASSHSSVRAQCSSIATASKYRTLLSRKLFLHSDCSNGKHSVNNVGHTKWKLKQDLFTHLFFFIYVSSCDTPFDILKTRLLSQHGMLFSFETSQHLHFWSEKCLDLWIDYFFAGIENLSV